MAKFSLPAIGMSVATILLSVGGGCASSPVGGRDGLLSASLRPYEPDVPLPAGFRLVDRASEDWSGGSVRYLRHCYRGRADKYLVRRFYREQMPLVRWTGISDGSVDGRITMRFTRGTEACTVIIEDEAVGLGRRVAVEVVITPLPR